MRIGIKSYLINLDNNKFKLHEEIFKIAKKGNTENITHENFKETCDLLQSQTSEILKLIPSQDLSIFNNSIHGMNQEIEVSFL